MAEIVDFCGLLKTIHKGFCLTTLEKLVKNWAGGSYLVMNSTPILTGVRKLMAIGYKYNSREIIGFISTEGSGSTEPGDPYLSHFHNTFSSVSVQPLFCLPLLGRSFNACNTIYNHNIMWQSDLALDKYWLIQSSYFVLETTVALGMGII